MICPYAGEEYQNNQGWFQVEHVSGEHPWNGKWVCVDWDAFCTLCQDKSIDSDNLRKEKQ